MSRLLNSHDPILACICGVAILAYLVMGLVALRNYHRGKLAELAMEAMWQHITDTRLVNTDKAIYISRTLGEIDRKYGGERSAEVTIADQWGFSPIVVKGV